MEDGSPVSAGGRGVHELWRPIVTSHRVLVVDDDFLVRLNTAEIFEEAGFEVIAACDVASALVVLKQDSSVGLVCTDVHMPGKLNGIDLATWLRNHHPDIKVIVMSCHSRSCDLPAGIPFISKPFVSRHLVELAREQLEAIV
jgi:DNA-binding NtrC family response regulator